MRQNCIAHDIDEANRQGRETGWITHLYKSDRVHGKLHKKFKPDIFILQPIE